MTGVFMVAGEPIIDDHQNRKDDEIEWLAVVTKAGTAQGSEVLCAAPPWTSGGWSWVEVVSPQAFCQRTKRMTRDVSCSVCGIRSLQLDARHHMNLFLQPPVMLVD